MATAALVATGIAISSSASAQVYATGLANVDGEDVLRYEVHTFEVELPDGRMVSVNVLRSGVARVGINGRGTYTFRMPTDGVAGDLDVGFASTDEALPVSQRLQLAVGHSGTLALDSEVTIHYVGSVERVADASIRARYSPVFNVGSAMPGSLDRCCDTCNGITACGCAVTWPDPTCGCCETAACPIETCGDGFLNMLASLASRPFDSLQGCDWLLELETRNRPKQGLTNTTRVAAAHASS